MYEDTLQMRRPKRLLYEPRVIAVIPARDEHDRITTAIAGLKAQTRIPDRIVVVANNCTDNSATANAARNQGVTVIEISNIPGKKAGALNYTLNRIIPDLDDWDMILVQDADSSISSNFIRDAMSSMGRRVGAIGGVFYGEMGGGLLGQLQRMEYQRYAWEIKKKNGKAVVLTGTASIFRVSVLKEVQKARRNGQLPGGDSYYSLASLTEDDEITKAIKTLGYKTLSPATCRVTTEIMPTLHKLWDQRLRWQRGALENLRSYGFTRVTARYFGQQIMMGMGALALMLFFCLTAWQLLVFGSLSFSPFWSSIGIIFIVEKVVSVWAMGWKARVLAALLLLELLYDVFQHAVYFRSLVDLLIRREERWVAT